MRHFFFAFMTAVLAIGTVLYSSTTQVSANAKKAIVVVSFGTTFDSAREACIGGVENSVKSEFPEYEVRRAFTSKIVMKRLADRGIAIDSLEQSLDKLASEGYNEIILQSTHLTPGEEFDYKVLAVADQYKNKFAKIIIGRPLLTLDGTNGNPDDFAIAMRAIQTQFKNLKSGEEIVFLGHGSPHRHNPAYQTLQDRFDAAKAPVTIGVVEETDNPNLGDVTARLQAKKSVKSITLMPLMLVAGDHANNDMAGEEEDSWKNHFKGLGYAMNAPYLHGLGENSAIQAIYVQHIRDAIQDKYVK